MAFQLLKNKTLTILSLLLAVLALVWFAAGDKDSAGGTFVAKEKIASEDAVVIRNEDGFEPVELSVTKGTRVVWVNETNSYVWPASNLHPTHELYPEFDPKEPIEPNGAWAFKFERVGEWKYHDHLKPNKRGKVTVTENLDISEEKSFWEKKISENAQGAYEEFKAKYRNLTIGESHILAHLFGEALYKVLGNEGIKICDPTFIYGCYHGFMKNPVSLGGLEAITFFGDECNRIYPQKDPGCKHGLGHMLLEYLNYDLVQALETCKSIPHAGNLGGCAGGVFMEYNFRDFRRIDQAISLRDALSGSEARARELDESNPYEPCSSLPKKFSADCYFAQPLWWQAAFNRDYEKIGNLCGGVATEELRYVCWKGIGKAVVQTTEVDTAAKVDEACERMPSASAKRGCRQGADLIGEIIGNDEKL